MDTEPDSHNETSYTEKDPLPVAPMPDIPPVTESSNPIVPPTAQQNVTSKPNENVSTSEKVEPLQPLPVYVIKDAELTEFERITVKFGSTGVVLGFLSFVAALAAAWFVGQQFKEMAAQTELLSRASQQSRKDSEDASIATNKQLAALQAQIITAQKSTKALQGQLKEAKRSTDIAAANLELDNRAWMKVVDVRPRGDGDVIPALSFQDLHITDMADPPKQQVFLNFEFDAKNVGNSAAINISIVPELYLAKWHDGYSNDVSDEESRVCESFDKSRHKLDKGSGRPVSATGGPVFPGETYTIYMGVGGIINQKNTNLFSDMSGQYILPVLIGCMDYQFQSSTKRHHVRFVYEAFHASSPRSRFFLTGQGIKAKDMQLTRNGGDDYAD